jgi:hypothetical protein
VEVLLILGSWTVLVPQLPASNSNSSQRLNPSSPLTHSLTNSLHSTHSLTGFVHLTPTTYSSDSLYCSSQLVPLIISRHGPWRKHRSSVAYHCLIRVCWRSPLLLYPVVAQWIAWDSRLSRGRCLATALHATTYIRTVPHTTLFSLVSSVSVSDLHMR